MNRIKLLREEFKEQQEDLAKLLNTTQQNISHYETGKRNMDVSDYALLGQRWNLSIEYIAGLSNERKPYHNQNTRIEKVVEKMAKMSDEDLEKLDSFIDIWIKEDNTK